jgi:uncharacterized protein (TIGR03435 family)
MFGFTPRGSEWVAESMRRHRLLSIAAIVTAATIVLSAQPPDRFDVVSIKSRALDDGHHPADWRDSDVGAANGNRDFAATNAAIGAVILYAYPVETNDLAGVPNWVRTARYDIAARGAAVNTREQRQEMVRALLADRFRLKVHYATETRPVFRLVGRSATPGPGLKRVEGCAATRAAQGPFDPAHPIRPCNLLFGGGTISSGVSSTGTPLSRLVTLLSRDLGRVVIDATHFDGDFAYELDWSRGADDADGRPPLPQALEEQLDLRLQPARAPVKVLVIDHIEHPTED